jgi:hypothetical protein
MKEVTITVTVEGQPPQTITVQFQGNVMPENLDVFINRYVGERPRHEERR